MRPRLITSMFYMIAAMLSGDVLAQARPGGNGPLPGDPGYQQPGYPTDGYQSYSYPSSPPQDDGLVDSYGAVVFGTKPGQKGGFYWFTGQHGSWDEAHSEALAYCAKDGGQNCVLAEDAINGYVGVAVSDDGTLFTGIGASEDGARIVAVGNCKYEGHKEGCRLLNVHASLPWRK